MLDGNRLIRSLLAASALMVCASVAAAADDDEDDRPPPPFGIEAKDKPDFPPEAKGRPRRPPRDGADELRRPGDGPDERRKEGRDHRRGDRDDRGSRPPHPPGPPQGPGELPLPPPGAPSGHPPRPPFTLNFIMNPELERLRQREERTARESERTAAELRMLRHRRAVGGLSKVESDSEAAKRIVEDETKLKASLDRLVNEHFEIRQQIRRAELEALRERLEKLKGSIEKREKDRKDLVSKRLAELTGDDEGF